MTYTFLIPAVIIQIFNPTAGLAIPTGLPTKKAKAEMEKQLVIVENKINVQHYSKSNTFFMLLIYQFNLIYFFHKIISCFF